MEGDTGCTLLLFSTIICMIYSLRTFVVWSCGILLSTLDQDATTPHKQSLSFYCRWTNHSLFSCSHESEYNLKTRTSEFWLFILSKRAWFWIIGQISDLGIWDDFAITKTVVINKQGHKFNIILFCKFFCIILIVLYTF